MNVFTFFRDLRVWFHKKTNPILWTKTSEAFLETIHALCKKSETIIEIGCGTAHVSYKLAKEGYCVVLNEIRKDNLDACKKMFHNSNVSAKYVYGDLFLIKKRYGFLWNSGLIQCFPDKLKKKLVKKLASISPKVLLFYPDTNDPQKKRGSDKKSIPGVDDAIEYNIGSIPSIMNEHFKVVKFGTLSSAFIGLPYPMYWIYGENI